MLFAVVVCGCLWLFAVVCGCLRLLVGPGGNYNFGTVSFMTQEKVVNVKTNSTRRFHRCRGKLVSVMRPS